MKQGRSEDKSPNNDAKNGTGETDAQKITRRHLENEDDIITDEDIRNIKIGPLRDTASTTGAELEELTKENENVSGEEKGDDAEKKEGGELPAKPTTPWDTISG